MRQEIHPSHGGTPRPVDSRRLVSLTNGKWPRGLQEVTMIGYTTRAFILATALVGSVVAAAPSANAGTKFDGRWSVVNYPRTGVCTKAFRIEGQISNGIIGDERLVSARVAPSGAVNFTVSVGPYHAVVFGRLSTNSGSGSWRLEGPNLTCSGTWIARRS
jgi:hypothetical protein